MSVDVLVRRLPVASVVLVATLMVFVVAAGPVGAATATPSSSSAGTWAYGAEKNVSVGPTRAADGWMYQGTLTIGYTVTVYDNNTSGSTFELTVDRTIGAAFTLQFCLPTCVSPTDWVNLSYRAYQTTEGFSNFTTQGAVEENGTSAPAVAIENSGVQLAENLTESSIEHLPILGWIGDHDRYLSADVVGNAALSFSPALGLIPLDLTPGSSWNASSTFALAGGANYSYYYAAHYPLRQVVVGPVSGPITFARTGNVTVAGAYADGSTVQLGGSSYPAISLTIAGPLTVLEGVVLLPNAADLFAGSSVPWAADASASTSFTQAAIDGKLVGGNFHLTASSWHYATASANPYDNASASQLDPTGGFAPAVSTTNPVSSAVVQGEPESPTQATSTGQCLTYGTGCPAASGSGSVPRPLLALVVIGGTVATVGALIALAVVTRRRNVPPPSYPNAVLYPPGATTPSSPARAPGTPGSPPEPEDDPLDHLW